MRYHYYRITASMSTVFFLKYDSLNQLYVRVTSPVRAMAAVANARRLARACQSRRHGRPTSTVCGLCSAEVLSSRMNE